MTEASKPDTPTRVGLSEGLGAAPERGKCAECRFAGPRRGYDQYTCRRRAPIAAHDPNMHCGVLENSFLPRWPLMRGTDWCGEFERA